jgi:peptide methionine sulfoxide reductase MsrA
MKGIEATTVGYTGGETDMPTYTSVCAGDGHTEAIKLGKISGRKEEKIWQKFTRSQARTNASF